MICEQNITFLRTRRARYLLGTPKSQLREFEKQLLESDGCHEVLDDLEARLLPQQRPRGRKRAMPARQSRGRRIAAL